MSCATATSSRAGGKEANECEKLMEFHFFPRFSVRVEFFFYDQRKLTPMSSTRLTPPHVWMVRRGKFNSSSHSRALLCKKSIVYRNSQLSAVAGGLLGLFLWQKYKILFSFIFFPPLTYNTCHQWWKNWNKNVKSECTRAGEEFLRDITTKKLKWIGEEEKGAEAEQKGMMENAI